MEETISFEDLGLDEQSLAAVQKKGFEVPSPIQVLAIPRLLNGDANVIARARTGTGKTAAFGLPLVQRIRESTGNVRALILEPTRELAMQTCREMQSFTEEKHPHTCVVYGGASMGEQIRELKRGADIVAGTPGRVQDLIERGVLDISKIEYFILDEGDEMLDMGFIEDIENIFSSANPSSRILLFSATMPSPILKIAQKFMGEYEIVEEEGVLEEPLLIDQKYWVVRESDKIEALVRLIDSNPDFFGLIFTQTKNDADNVSRRLDERGYDVAALHGDIPQGQREKILARFRSKKTRVLVATDVAARGIDITGLSHVVNYSLPFDASTYVHRIGRTGRAGSTGCAITFVRPEERRKLNFLKSAILKASKGDLTEADIPTIDEVISIKRENIFNEIKISLGLKKRKVQEGVETEKAENDLNQAPSTTMDNTEDTTPIESAPIKNANNAPHLIEASAEFQNMAMELCAENEPQKVLASLLSIFYGAALDKKRYGKISAVLDKRLRNGERYSERGERGASSSNQIRLYVQIGRKDGYSARSIADYFSNLLNIPNHLVDRIDVSSNFSLVSLPIKEGNKVLEMSKKNNSIPHVHIDTKEGGGFGRAGFNDNRFARRASFGENKRRSGFSEGEKKRNRFAEKGAYKTSNARVKPHTPTERTGSASSYKRSAKVREL